MKVLIVDDEPLARDELEYLVKQNKIVSKITQAESVSAAISQLLTASVDLIFLDISLNNENGFELANKLKQLANPPLIVFATAYDEYAVQAFDINAVDYVLKPFEQERINQAIDRAEKLLQPAPQAVSQEPQPKTMISVTEDEKTRVIRTADLIGAHVENGELVLTTSDSEMRAHQTLSWLLARLPKNDFMQVHRSVVVRVSAISEVEPWFNHTYQITLINGDKVPVSRSFVKSLKQRLNM